MYTLVWAGRIVDRCPDFESFTVDRSARLDRYLAEHGPGWLWYEPPLAGSSSSSSSSSSVAIHGPTVLLKKGVCLENKSSWRRKTENMGHYRVQMSFRRRKAQVAREEPPLSRPRRDARKHQSHPNQPSSIPGITGTTAGSNSHSDRSSTRPAPIPTVSDPDGPHIVWDTLLDSGATLPCIFTADLPALRIDPARYAAQSGRIIATAESVTRMRVYELDVGVVLASSTTTSSTSSSTVTAAAAADDDDDDEGGGAVTTKTTAIPVVALPGSAASDFDGELAPDRLSGLLPFHACYVSSAPGQFRLWLGEGRRDVLGAGRMPPGQRPSGEAGPGRDGGGQEDRGKEERELLQQPRRRQQQQQGPKPHDSHHHHRHHDHDRDHQRWWMETGAEAAMLGTPKRVVFEHEFVVNGVKRVLRDEESARGSVIVSGPSGIDFDRLDAAADGVDVIRIEPAKQATPRRRSEMKKAGGRKLGSN